MSRSPLNYELFQYLVALNGSRADPARLPSLNVLSEEMEISVPRLREQLEVAKALGLVDVRPRTGIRRLPYTFSPAVRQSLSYAIQLDHTYFNTFAELRNHIEAAYWHESVALLTAEDHAVLRALVEQAWAKLRSRQIQIPHAEHRQLHMCVYRRLDNPFVLGFLEAYWEAYEAVGLNLYAGYEYLQEVWEYHQSMVEAICQGNLEAGYHALVAHKDLLHHRPAPQERGG
ncbi:MAG: FCD domain-containing protein [Chloroflexi bacterium]|nr:FCD domain-containing protein [Chloroflexota bacterium]